MYQQLRAKRITQTQPDISTWLDSVSPKQGTQLELEADKTILSFLPNFQIFTYTSEIRLPGMHISMRFEKNSRTFLYNISNKNARFSSKAFRSLKHLFFLLYILAGVKKGFHVDIVQNIPCQCGQLRLVAWPYSFYEKWEQRGNIES